MKLDIDIKPTINPVNFLLIQTEQNRVSKTKGLFKLDQEALFNDTLIKNVYDSAQYLNV